MASRSSSRIQAAKTWFMADFQSRCVPARFRPVCSRLDIENQQIMVEGFYFRFWKYASDLTDQAGVSGQISPLIISSRPVMVVSDGATLNVILWRISAARRFWAWRRCFGYFVSSRKRAGAAVNAARIARSDGRHRHRVSMECR